MIGKRLRPLFLLVCLVLGNHCFAQPRIAIIIDDFGYQQHNDRAIINLPYALTCSVIPDAPHANRMARAIHASGKQLLIHLPMATIDHRPLDPGGLHDGVSQAEIHTIVNDAVQRLPHAVGLNNHMGSLLTSEKQPMRWLMQSLAKQHLFFIDSLTTSHSVAGKMAKQAGIPTRSRDIFLDNQQNLAAINQQFNRLLDIARQRGSAIAIGHPYPVTIQYLQQVLPLLKQSRIQLVPVSKLLPQPR